MIVIFFFLNDTATTEIYTLPLHAALPISSRSSARTVGEGAAGGSIWMARAAITGSVSAFIGTPASRSANADRKSTRLNSSHLVISYAVFCLKKNNIQKLTELRSLLLVYNS